MPDCDYCEESFDDEASYVDHLADSHEGELGAVDRRRVEQFADGTAEEGYSLATYGGVAVALLLVVGLGFVGAVLSTRSAISEVATGGPDSLSIT